MKPEIFAAIVSRITMTYAEDIAGRITDLKLWPPAECDSPVRGMDGPQSTFS
jgi:hypothetical protein